MTDNTYKRECKYCNKLISGNSYAYQAHLFQHNAVKPRYMCKVCAKPYFRRDIFARHMYSHFKRDEIDSVPFKYEVKSYTCDYCLRSFKGKRNLINHMKVHEDNFNAHTQKYKCDACAVTYCEERLLKHHIRNKHFNLESKENMYELKKPNDTWFEAINNTKTCVQMTKINNNVFSIKRIKMKTETHDDVTKMQSVYFKDILQYSKVICDYCNKEMLKKSLIKHITETHLKIRKFSCDMCDRTFYRHYQLTEHDCSKIRARRERKDVKSTCNLN
ncbi:zinc finger protein 710 [Amyelois transitella]|uniref:zinc finger protein 710 n=1 Tax=Amyelois transitella TaxID=680683 RepID=UPI00067B03C1|nr:zinc finger protein 710 [Amyelois transitella]